MEELNKNLENYYILFIGEISEDLKKVYKTGITGATHYLAGNTEDFMDKLFGYDTYNNVLELNERTFDEVYESGLDLYNQLKKDEKINNFSENKNFVNFF